MPEFDSFDDLTSSDPRDGALEVMGLPWRVDGRSAEILRDEHGIDIGDLLQEVQAAASGSIDQEVLDKYDIESAADLDQLPKQKQEEIAEQVEGASLGDTMSAAGALLHAGWVRFQPSLTREDVLTAVDLQAIDELPVATMIQRLMPSQDESAPDGAEDGDAGK